LNQTEKENLLKLPISAVVWKSPIREFTAEDVKNMATSLRTHGQIEPIVCKPQNADGLYEGVCGRLRYEGAKYANLDSVLVRIHKFESEADVLDWQLAENLHRKELTVVQKAEAFKRLYEARKREAGGMKEKHIVAGIVEAHEKLTGEKKAERTVWRYLQIANELPQGQGLKTVPGDSFGVKHALELLRLKGKPQEQVKLAEEFAGKPVSVKKLRAEVTKILAPEPEPLPEDLFNVIYADPPWQYEFSESSRGAPDQHYATMTLQEICDLKVPSADDAILFLWATNPKLEEALQVIKKWGFQYRTNLVWVKDKIGTGFYVRGQHELLLIGKKGEIQAPEESDRPPSVLYAPRREHSQKPDEVYAVIERMYPQGKYLELFARNHREGWVSWGA